MTVTARELDTSALLAELEPHAAAALDRHLALAKEWFPHTYVPWGQGRDFDSEPWAPGDSTMSAAAQTSFEVNLLTEDNLPGYHLEIALAFGRHDAWGTWVNRWTAEEARHAIVMRDYLHVSRAIDPVQLERGRMQQMQVGYDSGGKSTLEAMAYVAMQELATRISHRNTGRVCDDPVAERLLARVAADENLHMLFYRDLVAASLELAPGQTVRAIATEVMRFAMPGTGIAGFARKAHTIASAGIYDLRIHHDEVVAPMLRHWGVLDGLDGLDPEAEQALVALRGYLDGLDALATRQAEVLARRRASRA